MEKFKAFWGKVAAVYEWAAGQVAAYPKIALGVILGLGVLAVFG